MAKDVRRDLFDILRSCIGAAMEEGIGASGQVEVDACARRSAEIDESCEIVETVFFRFACCEDQIEDVSGDLFVAIDLIEGIAEFGDVGGLQDGCDDGRRFPGETRHDPHFVLAGRHWDDHLKEEAIDLGFRKRVCAFLFDWVLGCKNQERFGKRECIVPDGDLPFLHRFKERGLDLCGSAVDFVGEQEVCEDGTLLCGKRSILLVEDLGSGDIGGEEIRCKGDAMEVGADGGGEGTDEGCFGDTRDTFQKDMAAANECDQKPIQNLFLTNNDMSDFEAKPFNLFGNFF